MRKTVLFGTLSFLIHLCSRGVQSLDHIGAKKNLRHKHIDSVVDVKRKLSAKWGIVGSAIQGDEAWSETGFSTALSGDGTRLIVGSKNATATNDGMVKVYDLVNGEWQQIGSDLTPGSSGASAGFDVDISQDGSVVFISAPLQTSSILIQGQVFVYSWTGSAWASVGQWDSIGGGSPLDQLGYSLSCSNSGTRLIVGAPNSLVNFAPTSGNVKIWDNDGNNNWINSATLQGDAVGDLYGWNVAMSGDGTIIAVGAPRNDAAYSNSDSGHVKVYQENSSSNWNQLGSDITSYQDSWFGITVALSESGLRLAVGGHESNQNGVNSGHVVVFDYLSSSSNWVQAGQEIYGVGAEDRSGWSVTLSSDGNRLATSAPSGNDKGRVNIYDYIKPGLWADAGPPLYGAVVDGKFGYSLSLSGDGNTLAVGTPNEFIVGPKTGKTNVYEFKSWYVYDTYNEVVGSNSFDGRLKVENEIGHSVTAGNVEVVLFDFGCNTVKNSTGLEVSISPDPYSSTPHVYYVDVYQELLGNGTNFVFYDANSNSTGSVKFCTRVSTYEIVHQGFRQEVAYRETNFNLKFNMTNNGFNSFFLNATISENDATVFSTDVNSDFGVGICQCDNNYVCLQTPQTIEQDSSLLLCLEPEGGNDSDVVKITNFNLLFEAGTSGTLNYHSYAPISFGSTTWNNDALTNVQLQPNTNRIKVSAPITAGFFTKGFTQVRVGGSAALEFVSAKEQRAPNFSFFSMNLELAVEDNNRGCFKNLLSVIRQLF